MVMKLFTLACVAGLGLTVMAQQPVPDPFRETSERYVKLVLALGQHDADYVDAYYGPPEWRKESETQKVSLADIDQRANALETTVAGTTLPVVKGDDAELWRLRKQYLTRQLQALRARVSMLQGQRLTFDQESLALYDAVAPRQTEAHFKTTLAKLEAKLP